jgi:hypothetical protein
MMSVVPTYRITHMPGVTFMTANGVLVGLLVGAGPVTLAYAMMDRHLLGAFETADAAIAAVVAAIDVVNERPAQEV